MCKYTISDYQMMGEFLCKGFFATIKAFFDEEDGIEYNKNTSRNNKELADNSITVNAIARKAHAEILNAKAFKHKRAAKSKFSKQSSTVKETDFELKHEQSPEPNEISHEQSDQEAKSDDQGTSVLHPAEDKYINESKFITSLMGDYSQKLEEKVNKILEESKLEPIDDPALTRPMIKIMEEEDEYLESESSDEDSNSEPSEDNFSDGELEE